MCVREREGGRGEGQRLRDIEGHRDRDRGKNRGIDRNKDQRQRAIESGGEAQEWTNAHSKKKRKTDKEAGSVSCGRVS